MKHGFVKVAACTPKCIVANVDENVSCAIADIMDKFMSDDVIRIN